MKPIPLTATCQLCPGQPLYEHILNHLHTTHGWNHTDLDHWPDGQPVIIDLDPQPQDYQ